MITYRSTTTSLRLMVTADKCMTTWRLHHTVTLHHRRQIVMDLHLITMVLLKIIMDLLKILMDLLKILMDLLKIIMDLLKTIMGPLKITMQPQQKLNSKIILDPLSLTMDLPQTPMGLNMDPHLVMASGYLYKTLTPPRSPTS